MKKSAYRISLNIQNATAQTYITAKKNDTGRQLVISLTDGGKPYEIAPDCIAVFTATKPDGNILYNACSIANNTILYEITEQTLIAVGLLPVEIKLYGADNMLITSPRFTIVVEGTVYDETEVESTEEFSALTKMMTEGAGIKQRVEVLEEKVENIEEKLEGLDVTEAWDGTISVE